MIESDSRTGMVCPKCGNNGMGVMDTRPRAEGLVIRRRRACICGHRITTMEVEVGRDPVILVVNRHGGADPLNSSRFAAIITKHLGDALKEVGAQ